MPASRRSIQFVLLLTLWLGVSSSANAFLLQGNDWGGAGSVVSYSFDFAGGYGIDETAIGGPNTVSVNPATVMPAGWDNEIRAAFNTWAAAADISFNEVADSGVDFDAAGTNADIRISAHVMDGAFGTLAHGFYPPPNGLTAAGDIHFDTAETWTIGNLGIDIFTVALHEIGHALGLEHSGVAGAVMEPIYAYNAARTLHADDIAGIQALYNAPASGGGPGGGGPGAPEPATTALLMILLLGVLLVRALRTSGHRNEC